MAHFGKKDFPEISYCITDDYRREVQLTPTQAYELLAWLYDRRHELFTAMHPAVKEMPSWVTPETLQAWHKARATVEAYNRDHPIISAEQEEPLQWPETRDVHKDYQPQKGDVYLLEAHTGRFMAHRHNGQRWQYLTNMSEKDAHTHVAPMHYLGQSKGFRQYYRPTEAAGQRVQRESEHRT